MRIMFIAVSGKLDSYLDDLASFLNRDGVTAVLYPLSRLNAVNWKNFWKNSWERRHIQLENLIRQNRPDVIIFNSSKPRFDFNRIRSFYQGRIILYDMEGPNFPGFKDLEYLSSVDAVITVSEFMCRQLKSGGFNRVFYLPHGVNLKRFYPVNHDIEDERFFIGRPVPHRITYFTQLAENGFPVRLYGRKWHELPQPSPALKTCFSPIKKDINGSILRERISSGGLLVNVLQDHFVDAHTLVNMQVFFTAACQRAILTEYVDELSGLFVPDKEILIYRTFEELLDKVRFCHNHPEYVNTIAAAAYHRTISNHTLQQRSDEMLNLIRTLP